jgi:hypothetical protein
MKRFRLSTLLLLVVVAAMGIALVVQHERARRWEAELRAEINRREAELRAETKRLDQVELSNRWREMNKYRLQQSQRSRDQAAEKSQSVSPAVAGDGER